MRQIQGSWRSLARLAILAFCASGLLIRSDVARGQAFDASPSDPLPFAAVPIAPVEHSAFDPAQLQQRLGQQDAELQFLRAQIAELQRATVSSNTIAPAAPPGVPIVTTAPVEPDAFEALVKRLDALEKQASAEKKKADAAKKPDDAWTDMSGDKWTVKMAGHVQLDYINWAHAAPTIPNAQDYFEFRRLRLVADGTGYGVFDFRFQATLEPESIGETPNVMSPDVKDAYFSANEIPFFGRARIGNFFVPFSLEQVTNDTNNIFLERSIPTQGVFSADREVGVALYNCTEDKNLTWTFGAFFDSISEALKERIDDNQGMRASGRVTYLPYYDEPSNGRYLIHTGAGILYTDDQDNRVRFRARPQIHEGPRIIDSLAIIGDSYTTGNTEFAVVWANIAFQSELFYSSVNQPGSRVATAKGAYGHLSYFLTGENRIYERFGQHGAQFGRNIPYSNAFWVKGAGFSPGAIEAKARWSYLDLSDVNKGQYNDFTLGFNWYWTDRTRVMFDWIHPITSEHAIWGATKSDIIAMRFDWNW